MILSTFIDYTAGRIIDKYDNKPKIRTICLIVSLVMNIGLLGTFKYLSVIHALYLCPEHSDIVRYQHLFAKTCYKAAYSVAKHFFGNAAVFQLVLHVLIAHYRTRNYLGTFKYLGFLINSVNGWFGLSIPNPNLPLPIGISFFTFQSMSYTIDLYRRNIKVQKSAVNFIAFVTLLQYHRQNVYWLTPRVKQQSAHKYYNVLCLLGNGIIYYENNGQKREQKSKAGKNHMARVSGYAPT